MERRSGRIRSKRFSAAHRDGAERPRPSRRRQFTTRAADPARIHQCAWRNLARVAARQPDSAKPVSSPAADR